MSLFCRSFFVALLLGKGVNKEGVGSYSVEKGVGRRKAAESVGRVEEIDQQLPPVG